MDKQKGGFWHASVAIFWAFFGVRKNADYANDAVHLTPVQVIVAGLISAVLFVLMVLGLVWMATS